MKRSIEWALAVAFVLVPAMAFAQQPASPSPPLTLDAAVAEALNRNLDLSARRLGVTIAAANVVTAGLRPNPVLSLGADQLDLLGTGFNTFNNAGPPQYG